MIPNDFGIIRQADHNLFALLFPPLTDISEYQIEIVNPEYIDGSYITAAGTVATETAFSYAVHDVSKYDYVLLPVYLKGTISGRRSGFRADPATGIINAKANVGAVSNAAGEYSSAYFLTSVDLTQPYAVINALSDFHPPLICFIRHRNDGVNPLGMIQPLNPGSIQLDDPEPDTEDQEER